MSTRPLRWYNAVGLAAALAFALFPIFWMVSTSLKHSSEWTTSPPTWLPTEVTLANYEPLFENFESRYIMGRGATWQSMLDSFIVSGSATVLSLAIGLMAAIGASRYRAGGTILPISLISVRGIPLVVIAIPLLVLFGWLGLRDTHLGLILAYVVFTAPFAFWMLKSFIDEVPVAIEEAAMMDGMSRWQSHVRVTVPLIKGGLVATALFIFILNWSEFLLALVLTEKSVNTVPVNMRHYEGLVGVQAALATLAAAPIVVAGLLIHKHLARGFTLGAIKR